MSAVAGSLSSSTKKEPTIFKHFGSTHLLTSDGPNLGFVLYYSHSRFLEISEGQLCGWDE